jgi:dihydroorotate dehydrogenase (fumarate)
VERRGLQVVQAVTESVKVPVAVKLSPFYSSIANFARQLEAAGADALVLFNRFYQPDIDVEQQEMLRVNLSSPAELLLRLRWIGVLSGRIKPSLAATGGVHTAVDVVKAVMAGAHATQMVSALLQHGPEHLRQVRRDLERWLEEHEFESLRQMQGSMSLVRCSDPASYQRVNYIRLLQSWNAE